MTIDEAGSGKKTVLERKHLDCQCAANMPTREIVNRLGRLGSVHSRSVNKMRLAPEYLPTTQAAGALQASM